MTLLIAGADPAQSTGTAPEASLRERMAFYQSQGLDEQGALKRVARERGVSKSEVYREWQREQAAPEMISASRLPQLRSPCCPAHDLLFHHRLLATPSAISLNVIRWRLRLRIAALQPVI